MTGKELSDMWSEIVKNDGDDAADAWFETLDVADQIKLIEYWKKLGGQNVVDNPDNRMFGIGWIWIGEDW